MEIKINPIEEKYAQALSVILSDEKLLNFLDSSHPSPITEEYVKKKIPKDIENWNSGEAYKFVVLRSNEVVGQISLYNKQEDESYEIGYFVGRNFWGRGIGTEAIKSILDFGKTRGIQKVFAVVPKKNPASIRVLEKTGFIKLKEDENLVRMEYENKI